MKKCTIILLTLIGSLFFAHTRAKAMTVEAIIEIVESYGFTELKCESDKKGEHATGHITSAGTYTYSWDLGPKDGQSFWIWWDTLKAKANLTVKADGVVIFKGECKRNSNGETRLTDTSTTATVKRDGAPRLENHNSRPISYIRF